MSELIVFDHDEFGNVRSVMIDGEPWFVGRDAAVILGHSNPPKAIRDHVPAGHQKGNESFTLSDLGLHPQTVLISEAGLYRLIMRSNTAMAERFQEWVTTEVLPQIRKTGRYAPDHVIPKTFAEALELAAQQQRAIEAAQAENAKLSKELSEAAPKAYKWEEFMNAEGLIGMTDLGKVLGFSAVKLTKLLLDKGIFFEQDRPEGKRRIPYQSYIKNGMFTVKLEVHNGKQYAVVYASASGADHTMDVAQSPLARL